MAEKHPPEQIELLGLYKVNRNCNNEIRTISAISWPREIKLKSVSR